MNESVQIRRLMNGYQVSQAIHVAVVLGLPELLADGPKAVADLAERAGCQARPLYRLLRALSSVGVYRELPDRRFEGHRLGDTLRADAPRSIAGWALFVGTQTHWQSWSGPAAQRPDRRERVRGRSRAGRLGVPGEPSRRGQGFRLRDDLVSSLLVESVLDAYDFGGSTPSSTSAAAGVDSWPPSWPPSGAARRRLRPAARGRQRAGDARRGRGRGALRGGEPATSSRRCRPPATRTCSRRWCTTGTTNGRPRSCAPAAATCPTPRRFCSSSGCWVRPNEGPDAAFTDLNMLVGPGGEERTEEEYAALLRGAGFALARTVRTDIEVAVIEARPA
jgi:hypothetical protein